jgi:ribosomal-protein-alanine N-acetyltransferase
MPTHSRTTNRLVIRPIEIWDFESWKAMETRPVQNKWDREQLPKDKRKLSAFKKMIATQKKSRTKDLNYDFGVFLKPKQLIGIVSIIDVMRGPSQSAYIGYRIINTHWGKGFGKEAVKALIDIAFKDVKLHRVEAGIEPRNRASIKLAMSLGLRKEGLKKRAMFYGDKWIDLIMYSATCEEFGIKWKLEKKTKS